jgi:hypothetical protein
VRPVVAPIGPVRPVYPSPGIALDWTVLGECGGTARCGRPARQRLGSFIGGVFGLIYVEVNAGVLAALAATARRIAGAVAFAGLLALLTVTRGSGAPATAAARGGFGPRYWLVVAAEVAATAAGSALLNGPFDRPRAVVAWVSVVVGVHFAALAAVWRVSLFRWLGAAIALAGLAAAGFGASSAVIATVGGVLPGALLLAAGYRGASAITVLRSAASKPAGPKTSLARTAQADSSRLTSRTG